MRLKRARIRDYRSIIDTGWFDLEKDKTILVGPNEAGKTVLLQALQQLNPPKEIPKFEALRDYPRSKYNDITTGDISPKDITIVEAEFVLDPEDQKEIPEDFRNCLYVFGRKLDNTCWNRLKNGPQIPTFSSLRNDLNRFLSHVDKNARATGGDEVELPSVRFQSITKDWKDSTLISQEYSQTLLDWLDSTFTYVEEGNKKEENRYEKLRDSISISSKINEVYEILYSRLPIFVLFNNYFRVKPIIHLEHLASRIETNVLDDAYYDYGNSCLLKLLGFSARELSDLGKAAEPPAGQADALKIYRDQLDNRSYQLNAASVKLTEEIRAVWFPNPKKQEADRLRVQADGQYLKVVVEDELGVEIELDQRSEGFQWLVSFFVVFFAEAKDKHKNAVLLLDEPGLSLHGLKQRDFRKTISRLASKNQTLYTTHSPFLVGPDELDLVRVVEMTDRKVGTKVHTSVTAGDPAAMLPLQEALGYDLAQSLFHKQRNLVLEGLTDFWYIDSISHLFQESGKSGIDKNIALIPAGSAGKVVYFATILYANNLKVAALLDSDAAGHQAANQETLVHTLGNKNILRTKDSYTGEVNQPEIEDLLRGTLVEVAKSDLGWDIEKSARAQTNRPIGDIFGAEIKGFSKYRLAKCFLRWTRDNDLTSLSENEVQSWESLFEKINKALK